MNICKGILTGLIMSVIGSSLALASQTDPVGKPVTFKPVSQIVYNAFGQLPDHKSFCYHFSYHKPSKSDTRCVIETQATEMNVQLDQKIRSIGFPVFLAHLLKNEMKAALTPDQMTNIMQKASVTSQTQAERMLRNLSTIQRIYGYQQKLPQAENIEIDVLLTKDSSDLSAIYKKCSEIFNEKFYLDKIEDAKKRLTEWREKNTQGSINLTDNTQKLFLLEKTASKLNSKDRIKKLRPTLFGIINQTGFADFATAFAEKIATETKNPLSATELNEAKKLFSGFCYQRQESMIKHLPKIYRTYGYFLKYRPNSNISILDICFLSSHELAELNRICIADYEVTSTRDRLQNANLLLEQIINSTSKELGVTLAPVVTENDKGKEDDQPTIVEMAEHEN